MAVIYDFRIMKKCSIDILKPFRYIFLTWLRMEIHIIFYLVTDMHALKKPLCFTLAIYVVKQNYTKRQFSLVQLKL